MAIKNTPDSYGTASKSFHWVIGLLIIFMLGLGLLMGDFSLANKLKAYNLHKSIGVLILTLATLRVIWHVYSTRPGFAPGVKPWEKMAAHAMHIFLYLSMFGMPLSGWLMSSAAGRPVQFFSLFTLPDLVQQDQHLRELFGTTHELLGYTLIGAIAAHAGAALKHHFINKDATLRRMLPFAVKGE